MTMLSKAISAFVTGLLSADEDIVHRDAAHAFIAGNEELIKLHIDGLVESAITAEIKRRTKVPEPAQDALFDGLPAAVTVADGVTKPIHRCTWDDLVAGRRAKVDNIGAARSALKAYDAALQRVAPLIRSSGLTLGAVRGDLAAAS